MGSYGHQQALTADQTIYLFVKNSSPKTGALMSEIYETLKDEDGFLYMTYAAEDTLGRGFRRIASCFVQTGNGCRSFGAASCFLFGCAAWSAQPGRAASRAANWNLVSRSFGLLSQSLCPSHSAA